MASDPGKFFGRALHFTSEDSNPSGFVTERGYLTDDTWIVQTCEDTRLRARGLPWSASLLFDIDGREFVVVSSGDATTEAGAIKALERRVRQRHRETQKQADLLRRAIEGGEPRGQ